MGCLSGLKEYLEKSYNNSIFNEALDSKKLYEIHIHENRIIQAKIVENTTYEVTLEIENNGRETLPKINIKLLYPSEISNFLKPLIKYDKKIKGLDLSPTISYKNRNFIKNKTIFPLMKEKKVLFITLLEGEVIRGIISDFSRYDITVNLKGGVPITVLRHCIYDIRDKKGVCYLKSIQEKQKNWQKSELFV